MGKQEIRDACLGNLTTSDAVSRKRNKQAGVWEGSSEISVGRAGLLQDTQDIISEQPVGYKEHPETVTHVQLSVSEEAL